MLGNAWERFRMPQIASECWMLQNAPECLRMLPNASNCFRMFQIASECFQMLPNASRCFQMLPNASECTRMLPLFQPTKGLGVWGLFRVWVFFFKIPLSLFPPTSLRPRARTGNNRYRWKRGADIANVLGLRPRARMGSNRYWWKRGADIANVLGLRPRTHWLVATGQSVF